MSFKATPAQRAAIETTDSSIVLSAGAGSGKTRVLVQRYLHLIREGAAEVEQILAITFTNKAAGEMKERIMKEVFKIANQVTEPQEKDFWRQVKEDLNQAQITTFHGFCGQVLRRYPMEAGVDPFFQILDEVQTEDFLDDSVEEIFLEGLEAQDSDVLKLGREFSIYGTPELLKGAFRGSRQAGVSLEELAEQTLQILTQRVDRFAQTKGEICELAEELIQINQTEKLAAGTKKRLDELEAKWPFFSEKIQSIQSLKDWNRKVLSDFKEIFKGNVAKAVKEHFNQMKGMLEQFDVGLADLRAQELIPSLVAVLKQIEERYQSRKAQVNGLDFDDLERLTLQMLRTNVEFCSAYRQRYHFIMVDEFQDTNPVQEELIRLLIGGTPHSPIRGNKLFIVGDPKQSIYKFRGADVTVFRKMQTEINEVGTEIEMVKNFRSRGKIIDFVNHFFAKIFGTSDSPYDMPYQASEYARVGHPEDQAIEVQILDGGELKEEDLDKREAEADLLARRIKQMVEEQERLVYEAPATGGAEVARPVQHGDICILYQALTNVQVYEEALQRHRIPYTVVKGRGFYQRQEIWDLLNLLKLIDNSQRVIEWFGVLRSPFCGLSDDDLYWLARHPEPISQVVHWPLDELNHLDERAKARLRKFRELFQQTRQVRERKELSRLITDLLDETGYWKLTLAHPYGELVRANLDKLVQLAREYEQDAQSSLAGFIEYLERMDEKEAREGLAQIAGQTQQVKLMTVHQSKGLEFPVVIIPDTQRPISNPSTFPTIAFDAQRGIGLRVNDPVEKSSVKSSIHTDLWEEEKRKELAESKRLLYVAATRARDYLLISGTGKKFKPTEIDECKSWLDWLAQVFEFEEVAQLPETVPYGTENQHLVKINPPLIDGEQLALDETAATREARSLHQTWADKNWSEMYQTAGVGAIPVRAQSTYHQFGVSELLTYDQCPRWYYHKHMQKMPDNVRQPLREQALDREGVAQRDQRLTISDESLEPFAQVGSGVTSDPQTEEETQSPEPISLFQETEDSTGELAQTGQLSKAELGTLIHLLCEKLQSLEELPTLLEKALRYLGHSHLLKTAQLTHLVAEITPYLEAYLRREAEWQQQISTDGLTDRREYSFQFKLGDSLIQGVIDRLLITPTEAYIIDYKSNQVSGSDFSQTKEKYQLQLEMYALAVHYLTGGAKERIHARLYFLKSDQVLKASYGPAELRVIEGKVAQLVQGIVEATHQGMEKMGAGGVKGMLDAFPCAHAPLACPYHRYCVYHQLCQESVTESEI